MKKVIIIGGGLSGLFSAYYLSKLNYHITIIDNSNFQYGCSHGNAGLIVPSHITPLAAPGVVPQALKWMFNPYSPFSFHPKFNRNFLIWCLKFLQNSTKSNVSSSLLPLRNISFLSSNLYRELAEEFNNSFSFNSDGLMMLFKKEKTAHEEIKLSKLAQENGIKINILSKDDLKRLDPNCEYNVLGGVHYLSDSHLTPSKLINGLIDYLQTQNVKFNSGELISEIKIKHNKVLSVSSKNKTYEGDSFLFTSGVWSSDLLRKININVPLVAGKGYSFNIDLQENCPTVPSILVDARVAVTPMEKSLRIAGTMEIDSINNKIRLNRVKGMVNSFNEYFPKLNIGLPQKEHIWYGLRPCSPDGLPYIGRTKSYDNLFVATGHAMLGLSLGPATGKLISEIISDNPNSLDILSYSADRYN